MTSSPAYTPKTRRDKKSAEVHELTVTTYGAEIDNDNSFSNSIASGSHSDPTGFHNF